MTPEKIIKAYEAILQLERNILPYPAARSVRNLKKKLEEEINTIMEMERSIVDYYDGEQYENRYKFQTRDAAEACAKAIDEAMKQSDDVELPKVDLSRHTEKISISAAAMEALDGIVIFEGAGGNG